MDSKICEQCKIKDTCLERRDESISECRFLKALESICEVALFPSNLRETQSIQALNGADRETFKKLKEISKNMRDFVFQGKNLFLWSSQHKNGKLLWATRFFRMFVQQCWMGYYSFDGDVGCPVLYVDVPRVTSEVAIAANSSKYLQYLREKVYSADLVIWYGMCSKELSRKEQDILFGMINSRVSNKQANIFTGTLTKGFDKLNACLGERIYELLNRGVDFYEITSPYDVNLNKKI